jgi:hypothetical protein
MSFRLRLVNLLNVFFQKERKNDPSNNQIIPTNPCALKNNMQQPAPANISSQYACVTRPLYARSIPPKNAICYRCSIETACEIHHSFIHPWLTFTLCPNCHQHTDHYTQQLLTLYDLKKRLNFDEAPSPEPALPDETNVQKRQTAEKKPYQQALFEDKVGKCG